ncbi:MAG: tetratricopeptide repeat protein [Candidatus Aminicenantes bacterium]|nr:tetratricopeptide repeat protein [Candidatus Aminicenantes bacterium]
MRLEHLIDNMKERRFIGREKVLTEIYKKIESKEASVVIKGPGGSGKTALLAHTAAQLKKKKFSFILIEGETLPELILDKIYRKAHKKGLEDAEKTFHSRELDVGKKIIRFSENFLHKEKILLVFEDFEANLDIDGKFRNQRLKEFLSYLKDTLKDKEACLFFTTEKDIPGFDSTPIGVFSDEEFKKLLAHTESLDQLGEKSRQRLFFDMGGSPRSLQLLDTIAGREFGEKKFAWETLKNRVPRLADRILHKESEDADFTPLLLEKILDYLDESQQHLLKALSLFNGPVEQETLQALGLKIAAKDRKKDLDLSLLDFYEKPGLYRLHPRTARFLRGKLGEAEKKKLHLAAARYFENLSREQDITDKIAARRHYLEAEEWDLAAALTFDLDQYLASRGYLQLSFDLLKEIENLDFSAANRERIHRLLTAYYTLFAMYDQVISQGEKLLKIYEKNDNRQGKAQVRGQLAMAYDQKRKYDDALQNYDKSRQVYEELGISGAAAACLLEMGKIQLKRVKHDEALDYFQQALSLSEKASDLKNTAESLFHIGRVYEEKGEFDSALEHYRKSQGLKEQAGDEPGLAVGLHQMGNIYFLKKEADNALGFYRQSLELAKKYGDLRGQGNSLGQMGLIRQQQGREEEALGYYLESLKAFEELGDQRGISASFHQLGRIYQGRGELDKALEYLKKSLKIREETADMLGMALGYGQLGMLYYETGEYREALESSVKAFLLFSKLGSPGAKLAQKNIQKVEKHLPKEEFDAVLQEYNITPAQDAGSR